MSDKTQVTDNETEVKESSGNKLILNKFEYDLYHEEDDVSFPVIHVKRCTMPNKSQKWKFLRDNKLDFTLEGEKLSKKECDFLQTVEGINLLITAYKNGARTVNAFKLELKKKLKT